MTNEEAKFILSAFRPSGEDTANPSFGEALRMAGADPELGRWFERSRAFDAAVASKLGQITPQAGVREAILAGARVSAHPRGIVGRFAWAAGLAAAAALAILVAVKRAPVHTENVIGGYAGFAINDTTADKPHGGEGEPAAALIGSLAAGAAPMRVADQIDFDRLKLSGCRTLGFAGHDVLEVCFPRNGVMFHLYVVRHDPTMGEAAPREPTFVEQSGGAAAIWSDRGYDFALVSRAGVAALRRLL